VKIDIFNHILPRSYLDKVSSSLGGGKDMLMRVRSVSALYDLDERFRIMDMFEGYVQVVCLAAPPIEVFGPPSVSQELARVANDGMAELVRKHPDRFLGFFASLPMNDPDGLLEEARRAVQELGAVGVQVFSNVLGKSLTRPETMPLFDVMAELDRAILIHPERGADFPDQKGEPKSHYEIWWAFGWPYETSVAMAHLVFSGVFDRHPNIKIVTHHMGGMVPYFEGRVGPGFDILGKRTSDEDYTSLLRSLKKRPIDYFRMFYADTALFGARGATECGLKFFGADRALFGTDMPFDQNTGTSYVSSTIAVIDSLDITEQQRKAIYEQNARRILRIGQERTEKPGRDSNET
jgi:predicted TIM-barrel fold metal-dependent hydrolase